MSQCLVLWVFFLHHLLNIFPTSLIVDSHVCNLTTSCPPSSFSFNKEKQLAAQSKESRRQIQVVLNFLPPSLFGCLIFDLLGRNTRGNNQAATVNCFFFLPFFFHTAITLPPPSKCDRQQSAATVGDQNNLTPLSSFPLAAQNGCLVNKLSNEI